MNKKLIMLPEAYPVAKRLLDFLYKTEGEGFDLLILKKQLLGFRDIIATYKFGEIYVLDEEYYGRVTQRKTVRFLGQKVKDPYDLVYFPLNTFRANCFLFGSVLGKVVRCVNSSLFGKVADEDVPMDTFIMSKDFKFSSTLAWGHLMKKIRWSYENIVNTLQDESAGFSATGERPGLGIMDGDAHDLETFCKYAFASVHAENSNVLDVGGGIGYGSYLLSHFAESVYFLDRSSEAVDFVERLWTPLAPNIKTGVVDSTQGVGGPGVEFGTYDLVVMMDVIEHVEMPGETLESARRLLTENGTLILTTPEEDYYPYSVCPRERWGESEEELISEAIWPWHIQALGEEKLLPLLEAARFEVLDKSYTTYIKGNYYKERLRSALEETDLPFLIETLNDMTTWDISDFELTHERDPYFSSASYNIVARKFS